MVFRPRRLPGILVGSGISLGLLAAAGYLAYQLRDHPISITAFGLAMAALVLTGLAGLFAYWTYGCWSLRYQIDRNSLTIRWGTQRQVIPLSLINGLALGKDVKRPRSSGVHWPGYLVGSGRVVGIGKTLFYSAHRTLKDLVYVLTPEMAYGISVPNPGQFAAELELRQRLGAVRAPDRQTSLGRHFIFPLRWDSPILRSLTLGLLLNIALFGYIAYMYPSYPQVLPFNFTALGRIPEESSKAAVLLLPFLGLGLLLGNTGLSILVKGERLAFRMLSFSGIVVQVLLAVSLISVP